MQFFVGTSGFSYKEWKGSFYPEKLPAKDMLHYYAERFSLVEMNNTFYRMPKESAMEAWAEQTPETFRFSLKAPQIMTHMKRLKGIEENLDRFVTVASVLGGRLGPLLFQLPPNMKKDLARLEAFLDLLGTRAPAAMEFRHESWLDDEVTACLRAHSVALCVADSADLPATELVNTASFGYLRLRREEYSDQSLQEWIQKLRDQQWSEAYVLFKHEDSGTGPKLAARLLELAGK